MKSDDILDFPTRFLSGHQRIFANFIPDLLSQTQFEGMIWLIFSIIVTVLSFIDINAYVFPERNLSIYSWQNQIDQGFTLQQRLWFLGSGAASFTGVMTAMLMVKGKISNQVWGYFYIVIQGMYCYSQGYNGDFQLQFFVFLPCCIYGVTYWTVRLDGELTVESEDLDFKQWMGFVSFAVVLFIFFLWEIPIVSRSMSGQQSFELYSAPHILDALSNALSSVAQILFALSRWEQWIFWILAAFPQIAMWAGVSGWGMEFNLVMLFVTQLIINVFGVQEWYNRNRQLVNNNKVGSENEEVNIQGDNQVLQV